jgi:hypothetical protein
MSGTLYRMLALGALCASVTTGAFAQTAVDTDHDAVISGSQAVCGTDLFNDGGEREALAKTARNHPDLYRKMLVDMKNRNTRTLTAGDEYPFLVRNRVTGEYDEISATLVYEGPLAKIFVDNADMTRIKKTTTDAIGKALETTTVNGSRNTGQGIITNDVQVFGEVPPHPDQDGVWFLMTDIKDGLSGGFVGGFFSPWDQTDQAGSNQLNMLYIDSHEGVASGLTALLSTMAHEFQHLIHYNTNSQSEVFFNEGCSETASILNGYRDRSNENFLAKTNVPLMRWSYNDQQGADLLADYSRAMTFIYYCTEQFGESFLTKFNGIHTAGMQRIDDALAAMGVGDANWQSVLKGFAVANYVQKGYGDPHYVYKKPIAATSPKIPTPTNSYTADYPATGSVSVQPYGTAYVLYSNPGGLKIKFSSELQIGVMAMLYRGTTVQEVRELQPGTEYVLGQSTGYDKIVFAIINMQPIGQQNAVASVNWTAEKVALGVDDENANVAGALAFTNVMPQPAATVATVGFRSAGTQPTWLELYDQRGDLVSTVIDGVRYDAGEHAVTINTDGLATGVYLARLRQGASSAARTIVVMK